MVEPPSAADLALLDPDGSFALRLAEDRAALGRFAGELEGTDKAKKDDENLAQIELVAHRLAGAAGTFGHAAVSSAALKLEGHVIALRKGADDRQEVVLGLAVLMDALDRATRARDQ